MKIDIFKKTESDGFNHPNQIKFGIYSFETMNTNNPIQIEKNSRSSNEVEQEESVNDEFLHNLSKYKDLLCYEHKVDKCCYVVFNLSRPRIEFCCPEIFQLLGLKPKEFTLSNLLRLIHPEDAFEYFADGFKINEFLRQLPEHKRNQYKIQQSLRLKCATGEFIGINQEIIVMDRKPEDKMLRVFVLLSENKGNSVGKLRIIPLENKSTKTTNGQVDGLYNEPKITPRELEVLTLIAKNKSSKEIAQVLTRSIHTIKNHRKNMLKKTGASNSLELVLLAYKKGWI